VRLIRRRVDGEARLAVVIGDRVVDTVALGRPGLPTTMEGVLEGGARASAAIEAAVAALGDGIGGLAIGDADVLAPIGRPGKIIAVGRNYREHAAEGDRKSTRLNSSHRL